MPLTLPEAAKINSGDVYQREVIETFARSTDLLSVMPFTDIAGNALRYNQESTLPGIGFRGVNEGYAEDVGVLNPVTEPLVIAGGDLDVDTFIMKTQGAETRFIHQAMKLKHLAHKWSHTFIKGDQSADPRQFDGLQKRLVGQQVKDMGTAALQLQLLDEAIDATDDATHIYMPKKMRRRILSWTRAQGTANSTINHTTDSIGRTITTYNDLPILIADNNADAYATLDFSETGSTTSIYVLSLSPGMLGGIQNGIPDVRDMGELESKPALRTRVEWFSGVVMRHPRAATRLKGITDAPIAADA